MFEKELINTSEISVVSNHKLSCKIRLVEQQIVMYQQTTPLVMITPKLINVQKGILVYKHRIPSTCFGHSCDHTEGGALQRFMNYLACNIINCNNALFKISIELNKKDNHFCDQSSYITNVVVASMS